MFSISVSSKSIISPLLVTPKVSALAIENLGPGWYPPVKDIGKDVRLKTLSNKRIKSR